MEENENNIQNQVNDVQKEKEPNANPNKNGGKKVTVSLIGIILVLVLGIGIGGGFVISKMGNNKLNETNTIEAKYNKKIDESKPLVYDANYSEEKNIKTIANSNHNSREDITVPFININSEDAKRTNNEIKELYENIYASYGKNNDFGEVVKYKTYENDNVLSIILTRKTFYSQYAGTSYSLINTYNFNIDTLKIATLDEMSKLCGFATENDVINKINEWENNLNGSYTKAQHAKDTAGKNIDKEFFVDENKKLNFTYLVWNNVDCFVVEPNKKIADLPNENENTIQYQISNQDFSILKQEGLANTVYESEKKENDFWYKIEFDENANPTIEVTHLGEKLNNNHSYGSYNKFKDVKYDGAAGSQYVYFELADLNGIGAFDKGYIRISNVSGTGSIDLFLNMPYSKEEKYATLKKVEKLSNKTDYSVFSSYKGRTYKNEDFNTVTAGDSYVRKEYCELRFDENGKPTLKIGYKSDNNTECYFQTQEISNLKSDGAAGTIFVTFDFAGWTTGGDKTAKGNATISFSNVSEDYIITVNAKATYENDLKGEYNNIKLKQVGQTSVEKFTLPEFKNRVYESEKKENSFWYKLEFDENGKPIITEGYLDGEVSQIVDTYRRFTDVYSEGAAGSVYVTFSYRLLNETGDKVEGRLHYSNNTDNKEIYLKMYNKENKDSEINLKQVK